MIYYPVSSFPVDVVAAAEIALSAGHYYNDDFLPYVFNMLKAGNCQFVLAGVVDLDVATPGFLAEHDKVVADLCVEVPKLPRGHYMVIKIAQGHGKFWYKTVVSDGFGVRNPMSNGSGYETMPYADDVRVRFIKFEIYKCRQAIDTARREAESKPEIKAPVVPVVQINTEKFVRYDSQLDLFAA
jgi:hypothetical protein